MATSLMSCVNLPSISTPISTETSPNREQMVTGYGSSKSSFLCGNTNKLFSSHSKRLPRFRKFNSLITASSFDHIPKQFRQENLKEGLMENYKNVPEQFYGLSPSQMNMFATRDSPIFRQSAKLKEESLSAASSYSESCGMWSMSGMKDGGQTISCSMNAGMYRGGYSKRTRGGPPDLPSLLLDGRIVFLGMPIVPEVTELIVAQLMYLKYDDPIKPIYMYINSLGIMNEQCQLVADPIDAYAIADCMNNFRGRMYTVNLATAYGQAAMLLSRGTKGYRFLQPNSAVRLYLPSKHRVNGQSTDMYIEARNLEKTTNSFLNLLSQGIGKPVEELREYLRGTSRYFNAEAAIEYGIADKLVPIESTLYNDYDKTIAAKNRKPSSSSSRFRGTQIAPSGS